tara:strand:- start:4495 stop:5442 length:948 start_codon:yes stop_codon:yes gene_type:complete
MLHETPEWSARHHYFWHSNPKSKDRAKAIYEKTHVRVLVDWAFQILKSPQADPADRARAREILDTLHFNIGSANMASGVATQLATDMVLVPDKEGKTTSVEEAKQAAIDKLKAYRPISWDNGTDEIKKSKYLEELPLVIDNAIAGLREAMARENRILGEIALMDTLPGNALPHNTRPDYVRRGDLKTKWSKPAKTKSGWSSVSAPQKLSGMWEMNSVYQAAGFWALNGRQPPFILYASTTDYVLFTPDNAPELRDDFLADVVQDIQHYHKTTENILRAASTKDELLGMVSPDWSLLCWNESPAYLDEAKRTWGLI